MRRYRTIAMSVYLLPIVCEYHDNTLNNDTLVSTEDSYTLTMKRLDRKDNKDRCAV